MKKRAFDVVVASGLLLLVLPFCAVMALYIKAVSSGPVFFRQVRIGLDEKPFCIWKFRTMQNGVVVPRLAWMRRYFVDELPQLINVIRGEMSLVGPRPLTPEDVELIRYLAGYKERMAVRPGMTGVVQICRNGKKMHTSRAGVRLEGRYVKRACMILDMRILVKTLFPVIRGQGR